MNKFRDEEVGLLDVLSTFLLEEQDLSKKNNWTLQKELCGTFAFSMNMSTGSIISTASPFSLFELFDHLGSPYILEDPVISRNLARVEISLLEILGS